MAECANPAHQNWLVRHQAAMEPLHQLMSEVVACRLVRHAACGCIGVYWRVGDRPAARDALARACSILGIDAPTIHSVPLNALVVIR